jgi:hypothetical protein
VKGTVASENQRFGRKFRCARMDGVMCNWGGSVNHQVALGRGFEPELERGDRELERSPVGNGLVVAPRRGASGNKTAFPVVVPPPPRTTTGHFLSTLRVGRGRNKGKGWRDGGIDGLVD